MLPHVEQGDAGERELTRVARHNSVAMVDSSGRDQTVHDAKRSTATFDRRRRAAPDGGDGCIDRQDPMRVPRSERSQPVSARFFRPGRSAAMPFSISPAVSTLT